MEKKVTFIIIIVIILGGAAFLWKLSSQPKAGCDPQITSEIQFFYSDYCPHCKNVEQFFKDNKIAEKVKFDSLEVSGCEKSLEIFNQKADECKIPQEKRGVPMAYFKGVCYSGETEVESLFSNQAEIK